MALASEDDGFREIQLSGKQLVFLFMAATVVSVVIFLCGVLVGRGVRVERVAAVQAEVQNASPVADVPQAPPTVATMDADDPRKAVPPEVVEEAGASQVPPAPAPDEPPVAVKRDPAPAPPPATVAAVKPVAPPERKADVPRATPAPPVAAPPAVAAPVSTPPAGPPRTGYAVQVAATDARSEADAMVKRLTTKGYAAYLEQPKGTRMIRVRVGTFKTRREAQVVADRLKREEKFKPWVTR